MPTCHEAYFGIGKNHFHLRQYEKAIQFFSDAIKIKKDGTYSVWLGYTYLYYGINAGKISESLEKRN